MVATPRAPYDETTAPDWDAFVDRWWQRRVVVFRAASPIVLGDAFTSALAAGRRQLADTYDAGARRAAQFSIDGQQQAFVAPWLPIAADRDFAGYADRLAGPLAGRRHALMISRFHAHDIALWSALRAHFAPLWQRIGLPLTGAITTLFHGDYEATPTGVHKDRFATMMFALAGRKRMRFWPARPWREPVSTITRYDAYLATSFAVEVGPGDVLYWPSSYYHVGESVGGIATSANIGIPIDEHRPAYDIDDLVSGANHDLDLPEAERRRGRLATGRSSALVRGALSATGELAPRLPPALRCALDDLQRVTAPAETAARQHALWLARRSAGGFEPPPPPGPRRRLHDGDRVHGDRAFPVLLAAARGPAAPGEHTRGWLCAASGRTLPVIPHPAVPALFAALGSGRPLRVGDLLLPFGARTAAIRRLLEQLVALHALGRLAGRATAATRRRSRSSPSSR